VKAKLIAAAGIAAVVVVVIIVMKKGYLKDIPGVGPFLTL